MGLNWKFTKTNKKLVVTFKFSFKKELMDIFILICPVPGHFLVFKLNQFCFEIQPSRAQPLYILKIISFLRTLAYHCLLISCSSRLTSIWKKELVGPSSLYYERIWQMQGTVCFSGLLSINLNTVDSEPIGSFKIADLWKIETQMKNSCSQ